MYSEGTSIIFKSQSFICNAFAFGLLKTPLTFIPTSTHITERNAIIPRTPFFKYQKKQEINTHLIVLQHTCAKVLKDSQGKSFSAFLMKFSSFKSRTLCRIFRCLRAIQLNTKKNKLNCCSELCGVKQQLLCPSAGSVSVC